MLTIGVHHTLRIDRTTLVGLFLTDGTNDVLLPIKYVPKNFEIGDEIEDYGGMESALDTCHERMGDGWEYLEVYEVIS